ncbi:hypothetical protein D3C81_08540 [compost metagenome]
MYISVLANLEKYGVTVDKRYLILGIVGDIQKGDKGYSIENDKGDIVTVNFFDVIEYDEKEE